MRVVHFEIAADSLSVSLEFYRSVFGWQIQKWTGTEEYWFVSTGPDDRPGINGGMMQRREGMPRTILTVEVPSLDEFLSKVRESGGKVAVQKKALAGVGYQAYCQDPEGNLFGLHQADATAK